MKNARIISVDLGSAYTKISLRRSWDDSSELMRGLPVALAQEENFQEEDFCIPSVVARISSARGARWLVGADAASQIPGPSVTVFRNWKAALFGADGAGSLSDGGLGVEEAVKVAVAFFKEVRAVVLHRNSAQIERFPVRVTVPKLRDAAEMEELMLRILGDAGWRGAEGRVTVFEPESNALGLLSRGRNATWVPPQQSFRPPPQRTVRLQQMLGPGLSASYRNMNDRYAILVTDVGAFTTDFGYVEFDTSFWTDNWNKPDIVQESVNLGIRQLDHGVLAHLPSDVQSYFSRGQPSEWDRRKQQLYAGKPQKIVVSDKQVTLGGEDQAAAVQEEIDNFARCVVEARDRFLKKYELRGANEETVTGGGSAISAVRGKLLERIRSETERVHDLWDREEPDNARAAGGRRLTPDEKDRRLSENRLLVRGGSALGGASVFFE